MNEVFISKRKRVREDGKTVIETRQYRSEERVAKKQVMSLAGLKTGKQFRKYLQKMRKHTKGGATSV